MAYKRENSDFVLEQTRLKEPPMFRVVMHNDDYTTMEFVVSVLIQVFHKTQDEAVLLMAEVHKKGGAVVGIYTLDIAETKVSEVRILANEQRFPLLCTVEQE